MIKLDVEYSTVPSYEDQEPARYRFELHELGGDSPSIYRLGDFDGAPMYLNLSAVPVRPGVTFCVEKVPLYEVVVR